MNTRVNLSRTTIRDAMNDHRRLAATFKHWLSRSKLGAKANSLLHGAVWMCLRRLVGQSIGRMMAIVE